MDDADAIWNRSCDWDPVSDLPGDVALTWAINVDGYVQNGGVMHAVDALEADDLEAGGRGLAWLGLTDAAALVIEFSDRAEAGEDEEALELEANDRPWLDDDALDRAFRDRLASDPAAFAPLAAEKPPSGWRKLFRRS